ncbi:MAG: hypothetical protein ACRDQW_05570 [Haloechinothrix sp.]
MAVTKTVSYTVDAALPQQVKAAAERAGLSASAYVSRELRRALLRDAARQYDEWLASDPEVRAEIEAYQRMGDPAATLVRMDQAS